MRAEDVLNSILNKIGIIKISMPVHSNLFNRR